MIHDVLLSLLSPQYDCLPIQDFLYSKLSVKFFHQSELKILEDIVEIVKQYKDIVRFVSLYGAKREAFSDEHQYGEDDKLLPNGCYLQAFADGVHKVLQSYRNVVIELEVRYLKKPNFSLIFVYQQIRKFAPLFTHLMKLINTITTQRLHGCSLLFYLQQYSHHGNPEIVKVNTAIYKNIYTVFIKQLTQWIFYGKFHDIYGEFFIQQVEKVGHPFGSSSELSAGKPISDTSSINSELWGYEICAELLPQNLTSNWAEKVLFIGQTVLLFNSHPIETMKNIDTWDDFADLTDNIHLDKNIWNDKDHQFFNRFHNFQSDDIFSMNEFEEIINDIKYFITNRLSEIAVNQAELINELRLIKDFYLLGRGEFFLEFIKKCYTSMNSPYSDTTARDITKAFISASSLINFEMDQFSVRVSKNTEIDDDPNESTYCVQQSYLPQISLGYKVKWPLHLLFSPKVLEHYNEMFQFLIRIRKVQYGLQCVWCLHREIVISDMPNLLQFRNDLMFLVNNLQYYLQVDVLESQFSILMNTVTDSKDFEHIQKAHTIFQANMLSMCFLLVKQDGISKTTFSESLENPVFTILHKILCLAESFNKLSLNSNWPLQANQKQLLDMYQIRFVELVDSLMNLLTIMKSGPNRAPLTQLLLRLDFNFWFSSKNFIKIAQ